MSSRLLDANAMTIFRIVHYRDGQIVARTMSDRRLAQARDLAILQMETHASDQVEVRDVEGKLLFGFPKAEA